MTKKKSFFSKIDELKPKSKADIGVEKQLLPRLKFMGYLLLFFSFCAFSYMMIEKAGLIHSDGFYTPEEMESSAGLSLPETISDQAAAERIFFSKIAAISFIIVGTACFFIVWKKNKWLMNLEMEENKKKQDH